MKKTMKLFLAALVMVTFASCTTVKPGHKGVKVSWGGETDLQTVYTEGMHTGISWLWNDMVEYDVREKTMVMKFEFNDNNNMVTKVEISLDYNLAGERVNMLHTKITDVETKIIKTLKSAGKEVVPQYSAVELNITKRQEAEDKLNQILADELPEFYVHLARVQMTDVDIPTAVSNLAEQTAIQLGKNELATKKEAEQKSLAKAKVATAQGNYEAGLLNAKTKKLLSTPEILKLKELEVEMEWARQGKSRYGNNNMFGISSAAVLKGLK